MDITLADVATLLQVFAVFVECLLSSLLTLAWSSTSHKVQSLSLEQGVIDFDLQNEKSFGPRQIYSTLSRVKTFDILYCTGKLWDKGR